MIVINKDFVILITSHPDNSILRDKIVSSFKYIPNNYKYDVVIETGGSNWNEGFINGLKKIKDTYTLKYGVFCFDDDIYLLPNSFDNIKGYMDKYPLFQFMLKNEKVVTRFVRVPPFFYMIKQFLYTHRLPFPPFMGLGIYPHDNNLVFPVPYPCFSHFFIHKKLLDEVIHNFIYDPYLCYGEDTLLGFYMVSQDIVPYSIPNFVDGLRGLTKKNMYKDWERNASFYFKFFYIYSHPYIYNKLLEYGFLDDTCGHIGFLYHFLRCYGHKWRHIFRFFTR